ncbi:MAG: protein-disulfide reductase DsbD family protein, partial [Terrimicrobiaceae bacterium]|nr:protein-disulfide reductase DsbD family protein [Terrimicrobiaceae bacterium]
MRLAVVLAAWAVGAGMCGSSAGQEHEGRRLVEMRLVAEAGCVAPGQTFRLGVLLEMAPGWHTYWQNPGDAGLPTTVEWKLPEGFAAGPLEWPLPSRVVEPGGIEVYAYKGRVLLAARVQAPEALPPGPLHFAARA